jgi:hypothetical protein
VTRPWDRRGAYWALHPADEDTDGLPYRAEPPARLTKAERDRAERRRRNRETCAELEQTRAKRRADLAAMQALEPLYWRFGLPMPSRDRVVGSTTIMTDADPDSAQHMPAHKYAPSETIGEWSSVRSLSWLAPPPQGSISVPYAGDGRGEQHRAELAEEVAFGRGHFGPGLRLVDARAGYVKRQTQRAKQDRRPRYTAEDLPDACALLADYRPAEPWAARLVLGLLRRTCEQSKNRLTTWGALRPRDIAGCPVPAYVLMHDLLWLARHVSPRRGCRDRLSPRAAVDLLLNEETLAATVCPPRPGRKICAKTGEYVPRHVTEEHRAPFLFAPSNIQQTSDGGTHDDEPIPEPSVEAAIA